MGKVVLCSAKLLLNCYPFVNINRETSEHITCIRTVFCQALSSVPVGHTEFPVFPSVILNTIGLKINLRKSYFYPGLWLTM